MNDTKVPKKRAYEDIPVGEVCTFSRSITRVDVEAFAKLTGDHNPLHTDKSYAAHTEFKKNIVHGMLLGSLFSTVVGMHCPGERSLYLEQNLQFKNPVYIDEEVVVRGEVTQKIDSVRLIVLKMSIVKADGSMAVSGEAKVTLYD